MFLFYQIVEWLENNSRSVQWVGEVFRSILEFSFKNILSEKHWKFCVLVYFPIRMDPRVIMKEQMPGVSSHSENIAQDYFS